MFDGPTEYHERGSAPESTRCLACAATLSPNAPFCGTCGVAVATVSAAASAVAPPQPLHAAPDSASVTQTNAPSAQALQPGAQTCRWCGASNASTATRCVQCDAVFPLPDQDEALRRASESRVNVVLTELEQRERKRSRSLLGRLFGG